MVGVHGGGHAWLGVCVAGSVHGGGHVWWGACMAGDMCGRGCGVHVMFNLISLINERKF